MVQVDAHRLLALTAQSAGDRPAPPPESGHAHGPRESAARQRVHAARVASLGKIIIGDAFPVVISLNVVVIKGLFGFALRHAPELRASV